MNSESDLIPYDAAYRVGDGAALVLAPHPDDEVFGCAGAIMRHVAAGEPVTVIILTDGGGFQAKGLERDAHIARRRRESEAAAVILGYGDPQFWGYRDRNLIYGEPLIRHLCEATVAAEAQWLYAPSPYELHPDHRHLSFAALEVARRLGDGITLAFYEIGAPLQPNLLLDITDLLERKRRAITCFTSQIAEQAYDRHVEALNRYRTYTLPREVEVAEAYWVIKGNDWSVERVRLTRAAILGHQWLASIPSTVLTDPLVSVIVRTIGRPELKEALNSVALQTYPNIEIVVVNALGTDLAWLVEGQFRFPLRICGADHALKRSAAANVGLDTAQGTYLIFLDDDDWFEPDHIASLVDNLEKHPAAVAAYNGVRCVQQAGDNWEIVQVFNEPFDEAYLRLANYIPIHGLLFRQSVLEGETPCRFDEQLDIYEDWDFWLQLLKWGCFQHHDRISAYYRIHEGSGLGAVMVDQQRALVAFQMIVTKWRLRWSDRQLMEMIARAQCFGQLLKETKEQYAAAMRKSDEVARAGEKMRRKLEQDIVRHQVEFDRLQQNLMQSQARADEFGFRLAAQQAETMRIEQQWRSRYEQVMVSKSWRLTAPLRDCACWLRARRNRLAASRAR